MKNNSPLPLPSFYDAKNADRWDFAPDEQALFAAAAAHKKAHGIRPSASDEKNVHLLLIDVQKDFCFPRGSLFVGGRSGAARWTTAGGSPS